MTQEQKQFIKRVGTNISNQRKQKGFTIKVLAESIDMEPSNLVPILSGTRNITLVTLHSLAKALKCNIGDLLK